MRLIKEAITELERNPYVIRSGPDHLLSGIQASFYVRISRREETDRNF